MVSFSNAAKLATGRLVAANVTPYFSAAIRKLVPVLVPDGTLPSKEGTLAVTEGMLLLYEARTLERWNARELGGVLIHEVNHVIRRHATRRGARHPVVWNFAADAEINDDLLQIPKLVLPGSPVTNKNLPGGPYDPNLTAEAYYDAVMAYLQANNIDPNSLSGSVGAGACGGAAGNPSPAESQYGDQNRAPEDVQNTIDQTARDVQQHAKSTGSVPNGLAKWASQEMRPAEVPWQTKLARLCRRAIAWKSGAVDLRYSKPSRRQGGVGFGPGLPVLPAYAAPVPNIAIALDTSGSMFGPEMDDALAEVDKILKTIGATAQFLVCDADVHANKRITSLEEARALIGGGGGTDFRPVFAELLKLRSRPEVLIFFTDGYGPAPENPGPFKVIWAIIGTGARPWVPGGGPVEYGDFVFIKTPEHAEGDDA